MAPQHDYVIANGSGSAVRGDLNNALAAIVSNNSGGGEPNPTYAYQFWADTNTGLLRMRNAANNAWITLRELDGTLVTDGIISGGVERLKFDNAGVVFNETGADYDFRIEGDTNADLFYVDASTDRIGIGTNAPAAGFHIARPAISPTIGNVYITPSAAGQARLHLYNGGAQAEWLIGQKSSTDHDFTISKQVAGVGTDYLVVDTAGNITIRELGELRFADTDGTPHYVGFKGRANLSASIAWTLPAADGSNGQSMLTNGSGTLAFGFPPQLSTASGSAPSYGLRAWVNFDGAVNPVTIRQQGNVSSITDNGTGDYTVNFTTTLPSGNYAVFVDGIEDLTGANAGTRHARLYRSAPLNSSVRITCTDGNNSLGDFAVVSVAIIH